MLIFRQMPNSQQKCDARRPEVSTDPLSSFAHQRLALDQEPTILTVFAPGSLFILKWNPRASASRRSSRSLTTSSG